MPLPDRLSGAPDFRIKLPQDGAEARGHLLTQYGDDGTNKFLLRKGSLVTAEEWPGLGHHARRFRAELRASGALVDAPAGPGARWVAARDIECNSSSAAAALVYGYDAYTADTAENRILRAAGERLLRLPGVPGPVRRRLAHQRSGSPTPCRWCGDRNCRTDSRPASAPTTSPRCGSPRPPRRKPASSRPSRPPRTPGGPWHGPRGRIYLLIQMPKSRVAV